uniref:Uncharacterized protein n=1 Tax=Calidris pygmaea TaxID=425635 RepID=A0A8C3KNE4_9CHAR
DRCPHMSVLLRDHLILVFALPHRGPSPARVTRAPACYSWLRISPVASSSSFDTSLGFSSICETFQSVEISEFQFSPAAAGIQLCRTGVFGQGRGSGGPAAPRLWGLDLLK